VAAPQSRRAKPWQWSLNSRARFPPPRHRPIISAPRLTAALIASTFFALLEACRLHDVNFIVYLTAACRAALDGLCRRHVAWPEPDLRVNFASTGKALHLHLAPTGKKP